MEIKKVLVTGGDSFLARSIRPYFKDDRFDVKFASRKDLDCCNLASMREEFDSVRYDAVIHTAVDGGRRCDLDTPGVLYNNLLSSGNILFCHQAGMFKNLIVFGSGSEPLDDVPSKSYELSKHIQTRMVRGLKNVANLRIFGLFSSLNNNDFISACISACRDNATIHIWEDKEFDFICAKDLFSIILNAMTDSDYNYKEFDCVYRKKHTLHQIADMIREKMISDSKIVVDKTFGDSYIGSPPPHWASSGFVGLDRGLDDAILKSA